MKFRTVLNLIFLSIVTTTLFAAETTLPPVAVEQMISQAAPYQPGDNLQPLRRIEDLVRQSFGIPGLRLQLETGLDRLLANANATYDAKRFACQQLGLIGSEISLPALAELLKNDQTAGIACLALSTLASPKANTVLREALPGAQGNSRADIINALGNRRDTESIPTIANLVRHPDAATSSAAITALGKIATPEACQALAGLRRDPNPAVSTPAALASLNAVGVITSNPDTAKSLSSTVFAMLGELRNPPYPDHIRRAALTALLPLSKDLEEKRITEVITGTDDALKPVAIAAVRTLKSRGASARYAGLLGEGLQAQEQILLLETLAARDDSAAHSAILKSLNAKDPGVRKSAITLAGKIGEASSAADLIKLFARTTDAEETQLIQQTLCMMPGGVKVDKAIVGELKASAAIAPPSTLEATLVSVVAKRGSQSAVPVLLKIANSSSPNKTAAYRALAAQSGPGDAADLVDSLFNLGNAENPSRADAEDAARQALAKLPPARGSVLVHKALDKDAKVKLTSAALPLRRTSLLTLLPACPDATALATLRQASAELPFRDAAIRTLAQWPDLTAWDILADTYSQGNDQQRVTALRGLVRLIDEANAKADFKLVDNYKFLLAGARTDQDRKLILSAVAGAAHPAVLPLVYPLLSQPGVRSEAELAVKKIADSIKARNPKEAQAALQKLQEMKQ